jgi:hypothetical protein
LKLMKRQNVGTRLTTIPPFHIESANVSFRFAIVLCNEAQPRQFQRPLKQDWVNRGFTICAFEAVRPQSPCRSVLLHFSSATGQYMMYCTSKRFEMTKGTFPTVELQTPMASAKSAVHPRQVNTQSE